MRSSLRLGRIAGIEIGIHYTWLFAVALIAWSLAAGYFRVDLPGLGFGADLAIGTISALLLFASVLAHELCHSLVARHRGVPVDSITLFVFGGVSNLSNEPTTPGDEFLIAIVGPVCSLILAGAFWIIDGLLPSGSAAGSVAGYLALVNLLLGAFNLVPGFPLDGGRVFRSIVWGMTGSLERGTQIASYVGQAFGWLLVIFGLFRLLLGDVLGGIWTAFIGWFLNNAAETSRRDQAVQGSVQGVPVSVVLDPAPPIAGPELTVEAFAFDHVLDRGRRAAIVVHEGRVLGIASVSDVKKVPRDAWRSTPLRVVMTPAPLKTVAPTDDLALAIDMMARSSVHQLPVLQDGVLVGLISRRDIVRFLHLRRQLGVSTSAARAQVPVAGWQRRSGVA